MRRKADVMARKIVAESGQVRRMKYEISHRSTFGADT